MIAKAYNHRNKSKSIIGHAEIIAILKASNKLKDWRLNNCSMYVTLEPCEMCKIVIKEARLKNVFYITKRLDEKKQYKKVNFIKIDEDNIDKGYKSQYNKIIENFWKIRRKK